MSRDLLRRGWLSWPNSRSLYIVSLPTFSSDRSAYSRLQALVSIAVARGERAEFTDLSSRMRGIPNTLSTFTDRSVNARFLRNAPFPFRNFRLPDATENEPMRNQETNGDANERSLVRNATIKSDTNGRNERSLCILIYLCHRYHPVIYPSFLLRPDFSSRLSLLPLRSFGIKTNSKEDRPGTLIARASVTFLERESMRSEVDERKKGRKRRREKDKDGCEKLETEPIVKATILPFSLSLSLSLCLSQT